MAAVTGASVSVLLSADIWSSCRWRGISTTAACCARRQMLLSWPPTSYKVVGVFANRARNPMDYLVLWLFCHFVSVWTSPSSDRGLFRAECTSISSMQFPQEPLWSSVDNRLWPIYIFICSTMVPYVRPLCRSVQMCEEILVKQLKLLLFFFVWGPWDNSFPFFF